MKERFLRNIRSLLFIIIFYYNEPVFGIWGYSSGYDSTNPMVIYQGEIKDAGYCIFSSEPILVRHSISGYDPNIASLPGGLDYVDYNVVQFGVLIATPLNISIPCDYPPGDYSVHSSWDEIVPDSGGGGTIGIIIGYSANLPIHVMPKPEIQINSPNGGEILTADTSCIIRWTNNEPDIALIIEYSTDNGLSWNTINTVSNTGSYDWIVPSANSNQCLIRMSDQIGPCINDISDNPFTIIPRSYYYGGGSGTAEAPYLIYTAEDMNEIGKYPVDWDKHFKLMADIDFSGYRFPKSLIAYVNCPTGGGTCESRVFTGAFDGNGHVIHNLTIDTNGVKNDSLGLFAATGSGCEIKNLGIVDVNITAWYGGWLGGLVGSNYAGAISNCHITGRITGGMQGMGGLVGANSSGTINKCYSKATVIGGDDSWNIGGLVGYNDGVINDCYAQGAVIRGDNRNHGFNIGGLAACNVGTISNCYSTSVVTPQFQGYPWSTGGLVGVNYYHDINNCLWDTESSGISWGVGYNYGPGYFWGKTTEQMQIQSTFNDVNWDFVNIWAICEGTNYPKLRWQIPAGDFQCPDGVDFYDFAFFANHWINSTCSDPTWCEGTDFDHSGKVDILDLATFADHWLEGTDY